MSDDESVALTSGMLATVCNSVGQVMEAALEHWQAMGIPGSVVIAAFAWQIDVLNERNGVPAEAISDTVEQLKALLSIRPEPEPPAIN